MSNRARATNFLLETLSRLAPNTPTRALYEKKLTSLSDEEFDAFIARLKNGDEHLVAIIPNKPNTGVSVDNNLALAKALGHEFFERLWIGPKGNQPAYLTPVRYLVVDLPVRRASQHLMKKRSIPETNKIIDQLTYQPTGASKGAKISYPELQILTAMNMDHSLLELIKYRAGDRGGFSAMNALILRYGSASLKSLSQYATGVESTKTLKTFLLAAHLDTSR